MLNRRIAIIAILISTFFLFADDLEAEELNSEKKEFLKMKNEQLFFSISPVLSPRICFGLVKTDRQDDERYLETIWYVHAFDSFREARFYGLAFRGNAFISENTRSGFYLIANVGIDYLQYEPFFSFGEGSASDSGTTRRLFPNAAFGCGYSFRMKNDTYFRLEGDFGIKWFVSNLYLSFVW